MIGKGELELYTAFESLGIEWEKYEHGPAPTIEIAQQYWKDIPCTHCRNIFFRNHKGNRHYLVVLEQNSEFPIHKLEAHVKQGKLSFASDWRLEKHLGLEPGSVSPFGLINDKENHVKLFLDPELRKAEKMSFHPNRNTASVVISNESLMRFLEWSGNEFEWMDFL